MKSMKILVIGGSGILSSAVVDCCLDKGYEVTMMNRGSNTAYTNPKAHLIICDARNAEQVHEKTSGMHFDVVVDFIVYNLEQLEMSLSLFGNIANQYVFISSAQVYNTNLNKVLEETDETPQPLWSYSVNKDKCEKYLRTYCEKHHINYTIIRPGVNYDNRRIPYGMYPEIGKHWTMVARVLAGKPIITWNHGQNKLNLTRVEDFARGLVGLLGNEKTYKESFNVVGDYIHTWQEVLDTLGELIHKPVMSVDLPCELYAKELKLGDREMLLGGRACDLVCSNMKLKSVVPDYHSEIDLKEGISKSLEWYKANNYYQGFDYRWDAEQDRIIKKINATTYRMGYMAYSKEGWIDALTNRCNYMVEYYKDDKFIVLFWKCVRAFICKPLKRLNK